MTLLCQFAGSKIGTGSYLKDKGNKGKIWKKSLLAHALNHLKRMAHRVHLRHNKTICNRRETTLLELSELKIRIYQLI